MAFNDDPRKVKTTRKASRAIGPGEDGTRTVITDDTLLQEFTVSSKAALCDNLGIKRYPGQLAMLDEETANWMAKRGYIEVEIRLDARSKPARKAKLDADAEAGADTPTDKAEAVATAAADAGGGEPAGGNEPADADEAAVADKPRSRRKRSL